MVISMWDPFLRISRIRIEVIWVYTSGTPVLGDSLMLTATVSAYAQSSLQAEFGGSSLFYKG